MREIDERGAKKFFGSALIECRCRPRIATADETAND
jgi:hypothetical protein